MSNANMEITYDNLVRIINLISLSRGEVIHQEEDFLIENGPRISVELNGRRYHIKLINYPSKGRSGIPCNEEKPGVIGVYYNETEKVQRSDLLYELAQLELSTSRNTRVKAHALALEFQERYVQG